MKTKISEVPKKSWGVEFQHFQRGKEGGEKKALEFEKVGGDNDKESGMKWELREASLV